LEILKAFKEEEMPKEKDSKPRTKKTNVIDITSRIHPLPEEVGPSQRFMDEMRLRILHLQEQNNSKAA
jgi:hypothetical protein